MHSNSTYTKNKSLKEKKKELTKNKYYKIQQSLTCREKKLKKIDFSYKVNRQHTFNLLVQKRLPDTWKHELCYKSVVEKHHHSDILKLQLKQSQKNNQHRRYMTVVHIEKISTGLWTIFANFKLSLSKLLYFYTVQNSLFKIPNSTLSTILLYQKTLHMY